jgi:hypothetical protein
MAKPIVSRHRVQRTAARKPKSRSRRKPEVIEVDGHILTPEVHQKYVDAFLVRESTNKGDPVERRMQLALADALSDERPSHTAEAHLRALYDRMSAVNLALGNAIRYPFWSGNGAVIKPGCAMLRLIAADHYRTALMLNAIIAGIEGESSTKLQDWVKSEETLAHMDSELEPREVQS